MQPVATLRNPRQPKAIPSNLKRLEVTYIKPSRASNSNFNQLKPITKLPKSMTEPVKIPRSPALLNENLYCPACTYLAVSTAVLQTLESFFKSHGAMSTSGFPHLALAPFCFFVALHF